MMISFRNLVFASALAAGLLLSRTANAQDVASGHWEGVIELPTTKLDIRIDLDPVPATGTRSGTIDIPAQMLRGFALSQIVVKESAVSFALPSIPGEAAFNGTLSADGQTMTGMFQQAGQSFPFRLQRSRSSESSGATPSRGIPGEGPVGIWQGSLRTGQLELRLVLKVSTAPDGTFVATLDSLDQGTVGTPVTTIQSDENEVRFEVAQIRGVFVGTLNETRSQIDGTWTQGRTTLPLVFKRIERAPVASKPQDPKPPYPYDEREVTFENTNAGILLAGTLTTPRDEGPFPAVVLLSGSGPQNRDEELLGHRPFLVLADHLTRRGIAVLRFDDRGIAKSGGDFRKATHTDFADDARAAFEFLKTQSKIDPTKVGLCGHSEGGLHAPIVAAARDDVAFLVLLAGVGVPMEQLLQRQRRDIISAMGLELAVKPEEEAIARQIFETLRREGSAPEARNKVAALLDESLTLYTAEQRNALGVSDSAMRQQLQMMTSPWFIELLRYDPAPTLARVRCPVLALNGEKDLQVAADENLDGIRAGLVAGGNRQVTTQKLAGLNHLFQQCKTGTISEYGLIEETFNPAALETIADWILATASPPKP